MANNHAIVIGGSMAALVVARILSDRFKQVTLIERDQFPEEAIPRKGTPQSRHIHVLLLQARSAHSRKIFPWTGRGNDCCWCSFNRCGSRYDLA